MKKRWLRRLLVMAMIPALIGAGGCGGSGSAAPSAQPTSTSVVTVSTTPVPSGTTSPEEQVLKDYANYWQVYAQALRDGDASHLGEVMTGPRLDRALQEIADLVNQGKAVEVVVNSQPVVVQISGDQALLLDHYENQSHFIDPVTKKAPQPTPTPGSAIGDHVTLQLSGAVWKVKESVREVANP